MAPEAPMPTSPPPPCNKIATAVALKISVALATANANQAPLTDTRVIGLVEEELEPIWPTVPKGSKRQAELTPQELKEQADKDAMSSGKDSDAEMGSQSVLEPQATALDSTSLGLPSTPAAVLAHKDVTTMPQQPSPATAPAPQQPWTQSEDAHLCRCNASSSCPLPCKRPCAFVGSPWDLCECRCPSAQPPQGPPRFLGTPAGPGLTSRASQTKITAVHFEHILQAPASATPAPAEDPLLLQRLCCPPPRCCSLQHQRQHRAHMAGLVPIQCGDQRRRRRASSDDSQASCPKGASASLSAVIELAGQIKAYFRRVGESKKEQRPPADLIRVLLPLLSLSWPCKHHVLEKQSACVIPFLADPSPCSAHYSSSLLAAPSSDVSLALCCVRQWCNQLDAPLLASIASVTLSWLSWSPRLSPQSVTCLPPW